MMEYSRSLSPPNPLMAPPQNKRRRVHYSDTPIFPPLDDGKKKKPAADPIFSFDSPSPPPYFPFHKRPLFFDFTSSPSPPPLSFPFHKKPLFFDFASPASPSSSSSTAKNPYLKKQLTTERKKGLSAVPPTLADSLASGSNNGFVSSLHPLPLLLNMKDHDKGGVPVMPCLVYSDKLIVPPPLNDDNNKKPAANPIFFFDSPSPPLSFPSHERPLFFDFTSSPSPPPSSFPFHKKPLFFDFTSSSSSFSTAESFTANPYLEKKKMTTMEKKERKSKKGLIAVPPTWAYSSSSGSNNVLLSSLQPPPLLMKMKDPVEGEVPVPPPLQKQPFSYYDGPDDEEDGEEVTYPPIHKDYIQGDVEVQVKGGSKWTFIMLSEDFFMLAIKSLDTAGHYPCILHWVQGLVLLKAC